MSRHALGLTQHPAEGVPRTLSIGVKQQCQGTDHSSAFRTGVKNEWSYTSTPPVCLHDMQGTLYFPFLHNKGLRKLPETTDVEELGRILNKII
jgi:hypothetical protein